MYLIKTEAIFFLTYIKALPNRLIKKDNSAAHDRWSSAGDNSKCVRGKSS